MFWGALLLAAEITRAGVVVSLDDVKAQIKVRPWLGRYQSNDDVHHASIFYADGQLKLIQNVNQGQAWVTLEVPNDLLAEPLVEKDRDTLLGRHSVERACSVERSELSFTEFRTGWLKRIVRQITIQLTYGGVYLHRECVLEHRGFRGFADWFEDRNEGNAWVHRVSEHVYLERISERPMNEEEFARSLPKPISQRPPTRRGPPSSKILQFPLHRGCARTLEERP